MHRFMILLTVALLISAGAGYEAKVKDGGTPLHVAAGKCHASSVKVLLEAGAGVEAKATDGRTPLRYAAEMGHFNIVTMLNKYKYR